MSFELVFYSSEIEGVRHEEGELRLRFSAAHVLRSRFDGAPVPGYAGALELCFAQAVVEGDLGSCIGGLADGALIEGGLRRGRLVLPLRVAGGLAAEFRFINGTSLLVRAEAARCDAPDPAAFSESYAC